MEIVALGTSIVECLRIREMIERHGESFLRRAFTEREILYCQGRRNCTEHFASHWAAKEAVLRCLASGGRGQVSWLDLEIDANASGRYEVVLRGVASDRARQRKIAQVDVAAAHCRSHATATAIARGPT